MPESDAWVELGAAQAEIAARKSDPKEDKLLRRSYNRNREWALQRAFAIIFVLGFMGVGILCSIDFPIWIKVMGVGVFVAVAILCLGVVIWRRKNLERIRKEQLALHREQMQKES